MSRGDFEANGVQASSSRQVFAGRFFISVTPSSYLLLDGVSNAQRAIVEKKRYAISSFSHFEGNLQALHLVTDRHLGDLLVLSK